MSIFDGMQGEHLRFTHAQAWSKTRSHLSVSLLSAKGAYADAQVTTPRSCVKSCHELIGRRDKGCNAEETALEAHESMPAPHWERATILITYVQNSSVTH